METAAAQKLVLVLCSRDRRIWIYDSRSGVNALIPVSGFYNELMLQTGVHDPKIALDPKHLFELQDAQSDSELIRAFSSYNKLRNKVVFEGNVIIVGERKGRWKGRVVAALAGKKKQIGKRKKS